MSREMSWNIIHWATQLSSETEYVISEKSTGLLKFLGEIKFKEARA